jgi:F-type H+-transporting ATPase subunit a
MLNITLQPEYVVSILGLQLSNTFITSVLVTVILGGLSVAFYYNKRDHDNIVINGIRIIVFEMLKLTDLVTGNRKLSKKILPLIATLFLFIATANILALIPGFLGSFFVIVKGVEVPIVRSPNSDLSTTLALAVFAVVAIQFFSLKELGFKGFIKRFLNFKSPIKFIIGFFEMISEGVKVISFSFRLFGNIFAGEVLLIVIAFLVPYIIPLPFMILEVFVGLIQAFIFAMLTLTFIKTSTVRHIKAQKSI